MNTFPAHQSGQFAQHFDSYFKSRFLSSVIIMLTYVHNYYDTYILINVHFIVGCTSHTIFYKIIYLFSLCIKTPTWNLSSNLIRHNINYVRIRSIDGLDIKDARPSRRRQFYSGFAADVDVI